MAIEAQWWSFVESVIEVERDDPGVYELGDKNSAVVYIGGSSSLRRSLREHLNEPPHTCLKESATHYRVEYTANYENRQRELYVGHVKVFGRPPKCNGSAPIGN